MNCPRCAKENEDGAQYCSRCGLNFSKVAVQREGDGDVQYCYRHPKTATHLSCGRCEKPICDKCVVIGPAGPRCPDCAKTDVHFRPAAVGLGIKRSFRSLTRMSPWYLIILVFLLFGFFRGCSGCLRAVDSNRDSFNPEFEQRQNEPEILEMESE